MADKKINYQITAEDKSKGAFDQIKARVMGVTTEVTGLQRALGALGALGVVGAFGAIVKNAIDAADALQKMSQKVGISVEDLSRLKWAATQSDLSIDALGVGMKALSKNLVEAGDASSKTGKLMALMGVDASKGAMPALEKIADMFERLPDGATKATLAVEMFGKAGMDFIPLMNGGAAGIRKMTEEAQRLGLVINAETARAAETFNDNMKVLTSQSEALGNALVNEMAPGLVRITQAMILAARESGTLKAILVGIGGVMSELMSLNDEENVKVRKRIRAIHEEIEFFRKEAESAAGRGINDRAALVRIELLKEELRLIEQLKQAQAGAFEDQVDRANRTRARKATGGGAADDMLARINALLAGGKDKADEFAKAMEDAQRRIGVAYGETLLPVGELTAAEKRLLELRSSPVWATFTTQQRIALRVALEEAAAYEKVVAAAKDWNKVVEEATKIAEDYRRTEADAFRSIEEKRIALEQEMAQYGLLPSVIADATLARLEEQLAIAKSKDAMAESTIALDNQVKAYRQYRDALRNKEAFDAQIRAQEQIRGAWDDMAAAAGDFFSDLVLNGKSAFERLRDSLKQFAAELLALFAKRWVLNMMGSYGGTAGMGGQMLNAGMQTGMNSLGSMALNAGANWLAGTSAVTSLFGAAGYTAGASSVIANGSMMMLGSGTGAGAMVAPTAGALGSGGFMASLQSAIAAIPVWGWIAAAIAAVAYAVRDKGENWKAQIGFGANARVYNTQGVFGPEGFHHIAGDDKFNRAMVEFFQALRPLDDRLVKMLTESQVVGIKAALEATKMREFAFPKGDQTVAEQLSLQYLKEKYTAVFAPLDSAFSKFISEFTGKAQDLADAIGKQVALLEALASTKIKGLTIESLRAMQVNGETLDQTLQRLGATMEAVNAVGRTEAEVLALQQDAIRGAFETLGVTAPRSIEEWKALAATIDVSTEAGRALLGVMGQVGGAFQQVQAAMASAIANMGGLLSSIYGGAYGQQIAQSAFNTAANNWNNFLAQIGIAAPGYQASQTLSDLINNPGLAAQVYSMVQAGEFGENNLQASQLFNSLLVAFQGLQQAMGTSSTGATGAIIDFGNAAAQIAEDLANAKRGLADYLRGSLLSDFSPLSPLQRYNEARSQYNQLLSLAQSGDIDAISGLGAARDAFLGLSQMLYASGGQYIADYFSTFDSANAVTGNQVTRPTTAADTNAAADRLIAAGEEDRVEIVKAVAALAQVTVEIAQSGDPVLRARAQEQVDILNRIASRGGALVGDGLG